MLTGVVLERLPRGPPRSPAAASGCPGSPRAGRWLLLGLLLVPVVVCVYLSRQQLRFAEFPDVTDTPVLKWVAPS